ncbi:hypothetical protein HPS57_04550 [Prevotella sp. PINT]|jgi:hypothetical protein|uniref:hypothetical protein n=1 Tax=Palleniella intestinalis TaxID=2736291 RepID=UPI0015519CC3|nr:hypothetical protein [Palleniella intestinalis]NPD81241.1 hypothetical protein [Palleniella intestinalis]
MKKEYIAPAITIIPMEPSTILAASGKGGYDTENGPGFGGDTDTGDDDEFESLSKDGIWDDGFIE